MDLDVRVRHPFDRIHRAAGLCGELRAFDLWDGGDIRLPGARPARPRFRPQIRSSGARPVVLPAGADAADLRGRRRRLTPGRAASFAPASSTAWRSNPPRPPPSPVSRRRARARARRSIACATGASRASATGAARSRSSIAARCGIVPETADQLPIDAARRRDLRRSRQPPGAPSDLEARHLPRPAAAAAERETDTLDTFVDSSWYFARFADPKAELPVDKRGGGLLAAGGPVHRRGRARGAAPALRALRHASSRRRRDVGGQGAIRRLVHPGDGDARDLPGALQRPALDHPRRDRNARWRPAGGDRPPGLPIEVGGVEKMSKSKKNTVAPEDIIATYGVDAARLFVLSDSPPERDVQWTEAGVEGSWRLRQPGLGGS